MLRDVSTFYKSFVLFSKVPVRVEFHTPITHKTPKKLPCLRLGFPGGPGSAQSDHGTGQTAEDQLQGRLGKRRSLYSDWKAYSALII
jgi:hypothetical protein